MTWRLEEFSRKVFMPETGSSWSMSFDDEQEDLALRLPPGSMLLALVSVKERELTRAPEDRVLCASSPGNYVVRTAHGEFVRGGEHPTRFGTSYDTSVPGPLGLRIPGEGALAALDGWHALEWLSARSYEVVGDQIFGESESTGTFEAVLNPTYRFVDRINVGSPASKVLNLQTWIVEDYMPHFFASRDCAIPKRLFS